MLPRCLLRASLQTDRAVQSPVFANFCRHRAQPPQRPEADDGGALAGEAGDMCRNLCFSLQLVQHRSSCQSRRIAGTFDPRVSQDVDRQPLNVRENEQCLGPQVKGLRCRQRRVFRLAQAWQTATHRVKDTAQNTRHSTPPNWASPDPQMGPGGPFEHPQNPFMGLLTQFFLNVPHMIENTV